LIGSASVWVNVLVATLVRPQFGVLLLVPAVPFGALRQVRLGVMNVGAAEVLVLLVLAAWLMRMVARREIRWQWPPLSLPLLAFVGVLLLSTLEAVSLPHSAKEVVKWLEVLALYLFIANEFDERWSKALIFVVLGTGALAALHGIYQFLFQVGPEDFVLFGRFMRASGTFEQPNPYGGYLGLTLPLAVGLVGAAIVPMGQRVKGWWLAWAAGCGALMLAALVMTWSRGAWLGFGAALAAMVLAVVARSGRAAVLGTVFALLAAYILLAGGLTRLPPAIGQRFGDFGPYLGLTDVRGVEVTDANFAVLERMAHWQSALDMWTDRPWLGVGIGNYEPVYGRYALPLWPLRILGLAAYLFLWGAALLSAWRVTRQTSGWVWGVALGILGLLVHLSLHNLFDNLYVHAMYLQVALLLALLPILTRRSQ